VDNEDTGWNVKKKKTFLKYIFAMTKFIRLLSADKGKNKNYSTYLTRPLMYEIV
jgi:hypothetical protein